MFSLSSAFFYVYLDYRPFFCVLASKYFNEPIFGQLKVNPLIYPTVNLYFPFFSSSLCFSVVGALMVGSTCFLGFVEFFLPNYDKNQYYSLLLFLPVFYLFYFSLSLKISYIFYFQCLVFMLFQSH